MIMGWLQNHLIKSRESGIARFFGASLKQKIPLVRDLIKLFQRRKRDYFQ